MASSTAIGIDLGTTYSCVAVYKNGRVKVIANDYDNRKTPSCVAYTDMEIFVGDAARNQLASNPHNTIVAVKRLIGRRFSSPCVQNDMKNWPFKVVVGTNDEPVIALDFEGNAEHVGVTSLCSQILGKLKWMAENFLDHAVTLAVIAVPAAYGMEQRKAVYKAAELAGLTVLRLVDEPAAAALAFGFRNPNSISSRNILLFDMGGGSLDVSIVKVNEQRALEVKSTTSRAHLGGDDFDRRIMQHFAGEFMRQHPEVKNFLKNKRAVPRLMATSERAKRTLSENLLSTFEIDSLFGEHDFHGSLRRDVFECFCTDLFQTTLQPVLCVLQQAKLRKQDVDDIVLVGGSSRMPKIQHLLREYFDGKQLNVSVDADEAVVCGAALLAAQMTGSLRGMSKLVDVVGASIGIDGGEGRFVPIIPRGARIPCKYTHEYRTTADHQTRMDFHIYEGECALIDDYKYLGSLAIFGYPPCGKGDAVVDLMLEIDEKGLFRASAVERSRGIKCQGSMPRFML